MKNEELTHLSLFSGIGGIDLAAERAGFRTVGQCEWADYPTKVLEKHWPDVPRWRDIRTLNKENFHERTGLRTVDIISGGFPCQPFSTAGKRRGTEDDRFLWPEMCRVIQELRPTWVLGENVAGIISLAEPAGKTRVESRSLNRLQDADYYEAVLSRQENSVFINILEDLEHIGYEVQPFIVPACAVGAPHRRDRCIIVANLSDTNTVRRNMRRSEGQGIQGREPPRNEADPGCAGTCDILADADSDGQQRSGQLQAERRYQHAVHPFKPESADVPDANGSYINGDKQHEDQAGSSGSANFCYWYADCYREQAQCPLWGGRAPNPAEIAGGQLNPEWVEWLMGFPIGWTDCGD